MELFDFDFTLPDGVAVENTTSDAEGVCIDIVGNKAEDLAASIVKQAKAVGFVAAEQVVGRVELHRGEQRLLLLFQSSALTIQTYDPTELPMAGYDGAAVLLADFRVDCAPASIVPLRERHTGDTQWRRAAWKLCGISAQELVRRVIDEAVASKGLKRGAMFGPAKGGREVWSGEAYSRFELVKAHATVESGHVLLEIDLIDHRERIEGSPSMQ
jgi:hypothetical protein